MPIYEYVCRSCKREFEVLLRSMSASGPVECPECGHDEVDRKQSVFAARQAAASSGTGAPIGPCGRCGDPSGPCSI